MPEQYVEKALAGDYGDEVRTDAEGAITDAVNDGYESDAERVAATLDAMCEQSGRARGDGQGDLPAATPSAAGPAPDIDWMRELLELTDTGRWRDGSSADQARFVTEMLHRRGETLDLDLRVTLSVGVAQWAAHHDFLDAASAADDFRERLTPAALADGLNHLAEVQIDGVGFNVEDRRSARTERIGDAPDGDLAAAARALFEACEIGFERWEGLLPDCQQVMRERARRVVEAFHGRTRTATAPLGGYFTGSRCARCGCSFDQCTSTREESVEQAKIAGSRDQAGAPAPPCCSACRPETARELHDVRFVEAHDA